MMKFGFGRDIHRLEHGGPLMIGGVKCDDYRHASAHSDGDVLIHAIIDGMMGAACLGDIGGHFPDSDPEFQGIDSRKLLREARAIVEKSGYKVAQIDATVQLERPKLGQLKQQMRDIIAKDLGVGIDCVNVKAKTNEGFDAIGKDEAVSAEALVVLEKR